MFDLSEEIHSRRKAIADNIMKSFQVDTEASYFEKAHDVGDMHPNGKWTWTEYKPGKFDWRTAKKENEQKNKPSISGVKVGNIFDDIKSLNPGESKISSMGSVVSKQAKQLAESERTKIMKFIPDGTVADKILRTADKLSDKQLWAIAYELLKNEDYVSDLSERNDKLAKEVSYQKEKRSEKRKTRTAEKNRVKESIKQTADKNDKLSMGDKVKHERIGIGTVTGITSDKITIQFESGETKNFLPNFARLEKI